MAEKVFLTVFEMSLKGSAVILAVLLLRLALKKAPKIFSYILWTVVVFRLLCPVSFGAPFGVDFRWRRTPAYTPTRPVEITGPVTDSRRQTGTQTAAGTETTGGSVQQSRGRTENDSGAKSPVVYLAFAWALGAGAMGLYCIISMAKLKKRLRFAVKDGDIWECDGIDTAFVSGFFPPKIYIPAGLDNRRKEYILLHESHHIKRGDHIFKPVFFTALAIHWFNPLVWLAFRLMCRDMEMSCDETVIKNLGADRRADYCACLLNIAAGKRILPLPAFEEGDAKGRIKNMALWKKPTKILLAVCAVVCGAALVFLAADRKKYTIADIDGGAYRPEKEDIQSAQVSFEGKEGEIDPGQLAEALDGIYIENEPADNSRREDRPKWRSITVNGALKIHFGRDFMQLWIDDGVKPTFTYNVKNPRRAKQLFEETARYPAIPLTEDSAQKFIQDTLASLTLHSDGTVSFDLPAGIPTDPSGAITPTISLTAEYSEQPGYYSNYNLCNLESGLEAGSRYSYLLPDTDEELISIRMRVSFSEEIGENASRTYAYESITMSAPFEYEQPAGYTRPEAVINQDENHIQIAYTFKSGQRSRLQFNLPEGWSARVADEEYIRAPRILLSRDGVYTATIEMISLGTDDIRALEQVDTGGENMPGQIFAQIILSSAVQYEDYNVLRHSDSGRVARAVMNYIGQNDQWAQRRVLFAYDWQICPGFALIAFEDSADRREYQLIADSLRINNLYRGAAMK